VDPGRTSDAHSGIPDGLTLDEIVAAMAEPAAVVAHASQDREIVLRGTLGDIAAQVLAAGVRSTAVIIVGKVLAASGFRDSHLYSAARDRSAQPHT
jgi:precorrin-4/cobalt-precorrin-4 C11-methyltransferase